MNETNQRKSIMIGDMVIHGGNFKLMESGYQVDIITDERCVISKNFRQQPDIRPWMRKVAKVYPFVQIVSSKGTVQKWA